MFLFALDRIERGIGEIFCLYCSGFFLPAQGNRFASKSLRYQPSLGLRQRRMEEARRQSRYTGHRSKKFRLDKGRYPAAIGKVGTGLAGY